MLKRGTIFTLIIVIMGMFLIIFLGFNGNDSAAGSNENNSVFTAGKEYIISGEFDVGSYGIEFGSLFVEILEINDKWIKVDILDDKYVMSDLREDTITRAKNEEIIKDLWINTEKILYVMTEPDSLKFSD